MSYFAWLRRACVVLLFVLVAPLTARSQTPPPSPCSPSNWTQADNNGGFPYTFCPWTYLPWRVWLPDNPAQIDQTNTAILQQLYLPNSAHGGVNDPDTYTLSTVGVLPTQTDQGFSGTPLYVATPSDPLVHVDCTNAQYGCSDGNGNTITSIHDVYIPAWARPPCVLCTFPSDNGIAILQPTGEEFGMYQCVWNRDVVNGDSVGNGGTLCDFEGAYIGTYTTDQGRNTGNTSGGNLASALLTTYEEVVVYGQINHALSSHVGCVTGVVYPAPVPSGACDGFTGIPSGSLLWLDMTRAQIDADPDIPANMRVFAYAMHEHGMYVMDTGGYADNSSSSLSQPVIEQVLAPLYAGTLPQSPWTQWFNDNGGGIAGDAILKLQTNIMPWNLLGTHMKVLDQCYAFGNCTDSIPDPGYQGGNNPTLPSNR